jgi:UMF1 family MFS transporter
MNAPPARINRSRLIGYSAYDFANSAFATTILAVLFNQYFARVVAGGEAGASIGGRMIPGATLWAWTISLSMALVVLTGPVLGALADRSSGRLRFLIAFWLPGCVLTALLATVGEGEWIRGGLLFGMSYYAFSASSIFYNALLPEVGPTESLGRVSGIAWGVGYVGGALLLVLNLLMLQSPETLGFSEGTFTIQHCFLSVAVWWFLFALPTIWTFRYEALRPRRIVEPLSSLIRESLSEVRRTAISLAAQRNLLRFFFAYLIYNDGVQTVVAMASIFGAEELGMEPSALILFFLLIQGTAFVGSFILGPLADRWKHKPVLLLSVTVWALLTAWGFAVGIFGNALREFWILGGTAGLFLGGVQTCSRSLTAQWIPAGRESEMFGFFSIMTRLAAIFGPLVFGGLVLLTGSLRWAILSVTIFFVIGGALLATVREDRIPEERAALARE